MVTRDLPHITDSSHAHSTYSLANMGTALSTSIGSINQLTSAAAADLWSPQQFGLRQAVVAQGAIMPKRKEPETQPQPKKAKEPEMSARRVVQVYIADPDDNVPLDQSLLYTGEQKLTDLTDQELFFEIDIKNILADYNEKRVKIVNKKVKERTEHLEPVKVRDLKMVVVNVATF